MARREFPDPSLPVSKDDLWGFTYGEQTEIRRRRKQWLADNAAAVEAEKMKHARTCQICGRPIFAETGVIAHHGYRRPYEGYQTKSCYGARHLPFEKSRDILGEYIGKLVTWRNEAEYNAREVRAKKTRVPIYWTESIRIPGGKRMNIARTFWCETEAEYSWAYAMKLAITKPYHYYVKESDLVSFEQARENYAKEFDHSARDLEHERAGQQARYDAWVQTEK